MKESRRGEEEEEEEERMDACLLVSLPLLLASCGDPSMNTWRFKLQVGGGATGSETLCGKREVEISTSKGMLSQPWVF